MSAAMGFVPVRQQRFSPDEALRAILSKGGQFFRVRFIKRTTGEERSMLCRRGVGRFCGAGAGDRFDEDLRCGVLTVWDVEAYRRHLAAGLGEEEAGRAAYRRINLEAVLEVSGADAAESEVGHAAA